MKCPVCVETDLLLSERQGVEIDYCPKCRGVWLDRGELDKIIAAANQPQYAPPQATQHQYAPPQQAPQYPSHQEPHYQHKEYHKDDHHKPHKKSLLGELFDF